VLQSAHGDERLGVTGNSQTTMMTNEGNKNFVHAVVKMASQEGYCKPESLCRVAESKKLFDLVRDQKWKELKAELLDLRDPRLLLLMDPSSSITQDGGNLLQMVCACHDVPLCIVEALLEAGGPELSIQHSLHGDQTPLHAAVDADASPDVIRLVVQSNREAVSMVDSMGLRPLDYLSQKIIMKEERRKYDSDESQQADDEEQLEQLWSSAFMMIRALGPEDYAEEEPLLHACVFAGSLCPVSLRERVMKRCEDQLQLMDSQGNTPLHIASSLPPIDDEEDAELITELLQVSPDAVSVRNNDGKLPFEVAVDAGRPWGTLRPLFESYPEVLLKEDIPPQYYAPIFAEMNKKVSKDAFLTVVTAMPDLFKPAR
jgi:hypothetical protein